MIVFGLGANWESNPMGSRHYVVGMALGVEQHVKRVCDPGLPGAVNAIHNSPVLDRTVQLPGASASGSGGGGGLWRSGEVDVGTGVDTRGKLHSTSHVPAVARLSK
jgi:hypothetical protein